MPTRTSKLSPLVPALAARIIEIARREGYPVGQRLTELALCAALGVSRSPVRKALQHLAQQGVVSATPRKGYQLAQAPAEIQGLDTDVAAASDDALYLRIANERIQGTLAQEVSEASLMQRYRLQRLQVQRILNHMARDGLVERKPGRGWLFRPLLNNLEAHRESYRFRMVIEPAALLEPGYQVDVAELEKCRREQRALLDGGIARATPAELYRAGVHLHETMMAGAHNRFLLDALRQVNQMRRIVEYGTRLDRSRLHQQCEEHLMLIDLLLKGERMEASNFLRQHLNTARITKVGEGT